MEAPRSSRVVPRLIVLESVDSTNDELARRVHKASPSEWPDFSTVVTDVQTAGKGRLGRTWTAAPGTMLAASVLLRPSLVGIRNAESQGWLPLLAGLAMTRALGDVGARTELKWPNDVLIGGRKVCGILVEALAEDAVIVGAGVNLTITEDELPVPTATSMEIEGAETDADAILLAYLSRLRDFYAAFAEAAGDAEKSGLHAAVSRVCTTLGRDVRVLLPTGDLVGIAEELDGSGRLVVSVDGRRTTVSAGDVTHLRY